WLCAVRAVAPIFGDPERAPVLEVEITKVEGQPSRVAARVPARRDDRPRAQDRHVLNPDDAPRAKIRRPSNERGGDAAVHELVDLAAADERDLDAFDRPLEMHHHRARFVLYAAIAHVMRL